jgi:hypothetical protein
MTNAKTEMDKCVAELKTMVSENSAASGSKLATTTKKAEPAA